MHDDRLTFIVRIVVVVCVAGFALFYVVNSLRWPMVEDAAVMHYVNFLMAHGMRPYSDITDNNMPGAYLTEGWAMRLFGGSDFGWRVYDFSLLSAFGAAAVVIARPYDWLAGYLAWGMFVLVHASDGPRYTGQREEVIAVLLMVGLAALFDGVRRGRWWPAFVFGLTTALAVSIKPTFAPLPLAVLGLAAVTLRRRALSWAPVVLWAGAGMGVVAGIVFAFLLRFHALQDFLFILRIVTPAYRAVWPASGFALIVRAYPLLLLPVLVAAAALAVSSPRVVRGAELSRDEWGCGWEQTALLLGAIAGLASYYIQHKGFYHHRYTWIAFCFLLCGLRLTRALAEAGWRRAGACATLLFVSLVCVPLYARLTLGFGRGQDAPLALQENVEAGLERDLTMLAGGDMGRLQGQVLCFDLVSGCLSAMYHLGLVENSGFTGDLLFFRQPATASTLFYRELFWERARRNPANVLVITTEWFGERDSFAKVDTWPEFAEDVRTNYLQVASREFQGGPGPGSSVARAYRIYVRNGAGPGLAGTYGAK